MEIKAFKAWRFDKGVVGDVGSCIAPPYDVINEKQQAALYKKNPFNIVRIDKGKEKPSDNKKSNVYTRAGEYLSKYISEGALRQDEEPNLYAYVQNFKAGKASFERSGFIGLGKLQKFGTGVRPHEKTLDGPKADRLKLTIATGSQFGQIFMLYDDPKQVADKIIKKAVKGKALVNVVDDEKVRHRLFAITSAADIAAITKMMKSKATVIADGHHRYETALNYYELTKNPNAQWQMMSFVNMRNEGLVILPTHRLVGNLKKFSLEKLLDGMMDDFALARMKFDNAKSKASARKAMFELMGQIFEDGKTAFGIYAADGYFYVAWFKNAKLMEKLAGKMSKAWRGLDVSILHKVILEKGLGIGEKQLAAESNIEYLKDVGDVVDKAITAVDKGDKQVVFFMNPTRIEQVQKVAAAGEKMPQKSTFFHPKIFTGLTINIIEENSK